MKNRAVFVVAFATALALVVAAQAAQWMGKPGEKPVQWRTLTAGANSLSEGPATWVFRSEGDFQRYWQRFQQGPMPKGIDWGREQLIIVHTGQRSTGGFEVAVEKIERVGGNLLVRWVETTPNTQEPVTAVITSPFVIVRAERVGANVRFQGRSQERRPMVIGSGQIVGLPGHGPGVPIGEPLAWRSLQQGIRCRAEQEGTFILRNQADFEAYWGRFHQGDVPRGIDWSTQQVAAIHAGRRPSTGFQIAVERITLLKSGDVVIEFVESVPGPSEMVGMALTSPFVLVRMERTGNRVRFEGREQVRGN